MYVSSVCTVSAVTNALDEIVLFPYTPNHIFTPTCSECACRIVHYIDNSDPAKNNIAAIVLMLCYMAEIAS